MNGNYRTYLTELQSILTKECAIYERYLALLNGERDLVTNFQHDKLVDSTTRREELFERLAEFQSRRLTIMRQMYQAAGIEWGEKAPPPLKLTDFLKQRCRNLDGRATLALANKLRGLIVKTHQKGSEFNQILSFAQNVVNGVVAIFWAATQNVVRSYSRLGTTKEAYNPTKSRLAGVIKEA